MTDRKPSFHHVWSDQHHAHAWEIPCHTYGDGLNMANPCSWPLWPVGEDNKCDWCREFDKRIGRDR